MVVMFEIVFLVVFVMLGWLWFRRTNTYRFAGGRSSNRVSMTGARESIAQMPPKEGFGK